MEPYIIGTCRRQHDVTLTYVDTVVHAYGAGYKLDVFEFAWSTSPKHPPELTVRGDKAN